MTSLIMRVNKTLNDLPYSSNPSNYANVITSDYFVFSGGSTVVVDGATPIPSDADFNRAGVLLSAIAEVTVTKYFIALVGTNILEQIHLAGRLNYRYVFCLSFNGATASEPRLEFWDDDDMDSYNLACLGGGFPNSSWYHGICTTNALPGVDWIGNALAGSAINNIILLNDGAGALSAAKDLYFNLCVRIPAGTSTPNVEVPIFVVSYTTN